MTIVPYLGSWVGDSELVLSALSKADHAAASERGPANSNSAGDISEA